MTKETVPDSQKQIVKPFCIDHPLIIAHQPAENLRRCRLI